MDKNHVGNFSGACGEGDLTCAFGGGSRGRCLTSSDTCLPSFRQDGIIQSLRVGVYPAVLEVDLESYDIATVRGIWMEQQRLYVGCRKDLLYMLVGVCGVGRSA